MVTIHEEILTITEAANYLRIPVSTVYRLAQRDKIPAQKVGRHWRFRKITLDKWLDQGLVVNLDPEANQ